MNSATVPHGDDAAGSMPPRGRRRWLRADEGWSPSQDAVRLLGGVTIALAAIGFKLLVTRGLGGDIGFLSYVGAVALAAWIAGVRGGVVTTAISAVAETFLFSGQLNDPATAPLVLFRLGLFVFDGAIVSLVTSRLRQAMVREKIGRAIEETRREAEAEVHAAAERDRVALASLQTVTASLAGAATTLEVADAILDRGMTALGARAGVVSRLDKNGRSLDLIAARGYPDSTIRARSHYPLDEHSHVRDAVLLGQPVFLADPDEWARRYPSSPPAPLADSPTGGSVAILPLKSSGRAIGAVVFRFAGEGELEDRTRELALRLADQGAQALDRALAYDREQATHQALERSQVRLTFLARAAELIGPSSDFEAGVSAVPRAAIPALADWCAIELLDVDRRILATAASSPTDEETLGRLPTLAPRDVGAWLMPGGASAVGVIATVGQAAERPVRSGALAFLEELATCSLLVAPLISSAGDPLGSIVFGSATSGRYGPEDLAMTRDLAGRIAVAAERSRLFAAVTRFKASVDLSADAVYMFDPRTLRLTYVNRGGGDLIGFDAAELTGQTILQLHPTAHEATFRQRLADLRTSPGRSTTYTDVLARHDGREVPVDVLLQEVILPDGERTAILTARDISDRIDVQARLARIAGDERRQAAELRAVIQAMGEGVLVIDPDQRVSLANEAAATILAGGLPVDVADLGARLNLESDAQDRLFGGAMADTDDPPLVTQIEGGRWVEVASYQADLGGSVAAENPPSRIIVLRDVTEARDAEAAREAFLGVLSHELRSPVTTIFGYSKVLQRPGRRAGRAEMLSDIEVEADRLYRIVEDLLALSRVEGGITIEGEPLLLQHLAGPVITSEAQRWSEIRFELDMPPDLPAVIGERTYVEQVLRNLVSNAGKYSRAGTVVTVQAEATPLEVVVRVLDRGKGVEVGEADRLFDLYYRSPDTARIVAGAGIGLYVARGLITAMGGRIWARPRAGGGSEFGFSLPRCDEDVLVPGSARGG